MRFAQSLSAASSHEELERSFIAGFGRLMDVPIYGYDLVDPISGRPTCVATANVSDTFVARYEREARAVDPVLARAYETGRPAYNLAMMSVQEWEETVVYRRAYCMHGIRHVVEAPVIRAGRITGNLHFADSDTARDFGPGEIRLTEALAGLLGATIDAIESRGVVERERDEALAALEVTGTPVVVSDPRSTELRLNGAARRLLADVVEAEERLHRLMARPTTNGGFSRRLEVELTTGEVATIHSHSCPVPHDDGGIVAVMELEHERPGIAPGLLSALTPREREVAVLVVDGLADREDRRAPLPQPPHREPVREAHLPQARRRLACRAHPRAARPPRRHPPRLGADGRDEPGQRG